MPPTVGESSVATELILIQLPGPYPRRKEKTTTPPKIRISLFRMGPNTKRYGFGAGGLGDLGELSIDVDLSLIDVFVEEHITPHWIELRICR